jgi:RNA polymerase sigma-70 factor, ECF subfamily
MEEHTDEQLVSAYLSGVEDAFRELVERYLKPVYHFVYRYVKTQGDAEDIVQDTFLSAWKNIEKFDTRKKFKTWIFTIAKNASLNWIKKKKPSLFSQFENEAGENILAEIVADPSPLPDELFRKAQLREEVTFAMEKLSGAHQTVLSLRHREQFTFQEISELLNESIHTVKSRHRRALAALKKVLTSS